MLFGLVSVAAIACLEVLRRIWKRSRRCDLTYFHGLGNGVLVLNSLNAINDLLDRRGNIYSHRPILTVGGELMGIDQTTVFMPHGPQWREHRRLAHTALNPTAVKQYHNTQQRIATLLCKGLLDRPEDFHSLARLAAGRIVMSVTYGLSVDDSQEHIMCAEQLMLILGKVVLPGAYLADLIPVLKYLPSWVPFQREVASTRRLLYQVLNQPFSHFEEDRRMGIAGPSLAFDLMSHEAGSTLTDEQLRTIKWVLVTTYNAGTESVQQTHGTIISFILAMARFPEKQRLAQEEIDRVLGGKRMPTIADLPNLPYVNAVIKETMRLHPVVPLGIPRRTAEDDEYMGNHIPKGTIIIPNVWSIALTPNCQYDPHEFIPERFLDSSAEIPDPFAYLFGFGRRVCPGKVLGQNSIFIFIASILATFDISFTPGREKQEPKFLGGVVRSVSSSLNFIAGH
ncbi:hypothetical protein VNI00_007910 [Paramarasmius palmivorus]|uniref:Cytochrome P450 n=1 Tax=Paramarasmius palmivorus TaxID=297713 RepID=A0AAW0CXT2_9AGAR